MKFFKTICMFLVVMSLLATTAMAAGLSDALSDFEVQINDDDVETGASNSVSIDRGDIIDVEVRMTSAVDIKNVEILAMISGYEFNDIEPMRDSSEIFDMEANVTYKKTISLRVPSDVEEDTYLLRILVSDRSSDIARYEYKLLLDSPRHGFQIKDVVFSPGNVVEAGRALLTTVRVENMGDRQEDSVKVTVAVPELGISASDFIDEIDSDDSETTEEMYLRIPVCAKAGDYNAVIEVRYNDLRESMYENAIITVVPTDACEAALPAGNAGTGKTVIAVGTTSQELATGSAGTLYPLTVTNNGASAKTYTVTVEGVSNFATATINPVSTFVLGKDESQAVFVYLTALDNAAAGEHVFTVTVKSGNEVLKQVAMTAVVAKGETKGSASSMELRNVLEIGLIILVVVLVILAIVIGVSRIKKDDNNEEEVEGKTYY